MASKNQQWKASGTDMSFKDWLRQDLDNNVQNTVSFIKDKEIEKAKINDNAGWSNQTGDPNNNYEPNLNNNTVLGINNWLVYGVIGIVAIGIVVAIYNKETKLQNS